MAFPSKPAKPATQPPFGGGPKPPAAKPAGGPGLPLSLASLMQPKKTLPGGGGPANLQAQPTQNKTPDGGVAAYMSPDQGPFECDKCEHFDGNGNCNKPEVVQELGKNDQGLATVDPKGCCNYFEPGQNSKTDNQPSSNAVKPYGF